MSHPVIAYNKPALTLADQLQRLHQVKGLVIHDEVAAFAALKSIGYNRLLIYMRALQDGRKFFLPGKSFDDVLSLYDFDRKLRLLCMDAIERIEVALRSALANTLTVALGSHFYLNCHHYVSHRCMMEFTSKAAQAKSIAIEHYTRKYNSPSYPPLWTVLESVTYENLSCLFSNLHLDNRKLVAPEFGYDETVLVSWFRSINVVRNMCAHHNRLWNAAIVVNMPVKAKHVRQEWPVAANGSSTFAARAIVMAALLKEIEPDSDWHVRFRQMATSCSVMSSDMGFENGWDQRPFWN